MSLPRAREARESSSWRGAPAGRRAAAAAVREDA
eukprot:COSAG03_NODE_3367_length_2056_cov_13.128769_4_plen_33_part_01